jgi:ParB family chromosome partitioning protein
VTRRRLGRGLDALLGADQAHRDATLPPDAARAGQDVALSDGSASAAPGIAIDHIHRGRYQPRIEFDEASIAELASSIRAQGLMQPVVVRPRAQGGYELIAGERRWRAARLAGLELIPAIVREVSDVQASAMALIENVQRENLSPLEEAGALSRLKDEFALTQAEVADAIGKSRVAVANLLRLLNLTGEVRQLLVDGRIEMGHARALLSLEGTIQVGAGLQVADRGLSVRQTEALVRRLLAERERTPDAANHDPDTARLERDLGDRIGATVRIAANARGRGTITISFSSLDELDGILNHIR